jgi:hypothetical protein
LLLKKPILAEKLVVVFKGIKTYSRPDSSSQSGWQTSQVTIHKSEVVLGAQKEYFNEQYQFQINIPVNILQKSPLYEGAIGTAVNILQNLSGTSEETDWYVEASLDIPKSVDIKKCVSITLPNPS